MRSRALSIATVAGIAVLTAMPYAAHATGIPFFGPIIPTDYNACPLGWAAVIQVLNNLIAFGITIAITFIAPLSIAYAGFLFVISPTNPGQRSKAKDVLWNTVIGIVVALAAYLIVDAMLTALTSKSVAGWTAQVFSNGGDICLPQTSSTDQIGNAPVTGITSGGGLVTNGGKVAQCTSSNTACSPSALQSAGFSATQAQIMSCIAFTESSGNPAQPPYNSTHPTSNSSACGLFQITQTTWNGAASGACSSFSSCTNAACNTQVAIQLVSKSGYSSWTCDKCNPSAAACIQKYGGN